MGRIAVIDTNVVLYSINPSSRRYEEARGLINSLDKVVLPIIVVYELIWNLAVTGVPPKEAKKTVSRILLNERVTLVDDRQYLLRAFDLFGNLSLKHYNDSVILAIAKETGALATYDKKLRKRGRKLGVKVLPEVIE
ncbi:nucleotide-binding protein [Thermococcus celericrescens]|uniref:Nucleotide-binding protein n=1 Tax=Thermococcus celericrescens TaxID=227598 RepID=A0A100XWZ2_9EURY|nr:PIN domain-containing protein [Thermococcus celericrescens]KUH32642.1 nucleotide-binding protein [Thermococcus celericrescens]